MVVKDFYYLVSVAETVFVIPAKPVLSLAEGAGIQFFALDPCFGFPQGGVPRRGDIVGFCFPQQILLRIEPSTHTQHNSPDSVCSSEDSSTTPPPDLAEWLEYNSCDSTEPVDVHESPC